MNILTRLISDIHSDFAGEISPSDLFDSYIAVVFHQKNEDSLLVKLLNLQFLLVKSHVVPGSKNLLIRFQWFVGKIPTNPSSIGYSYGSIPPKNTSNIRLQKNEHQKTCSSPHRLGVHFGYMSGTRRLELRF